MAGEPRYVAETQILRGVLSNPKCRFRYTKHALERMAERDITDPDVVSALTNGQVTLVEYKTDFVWRVRGKDIDGRSLQVEVAVYEDEVRVKVITAF